MYAQGRGVEKDSLLAVNLYIRSAKNGYSESLDNLSLIVDLEINTAKREREAAEERADQSRKEMVEAEYEMVEAEHVHTQTVVELKDQLTELRNQVAKAQQHAAKHETADLL